MWTPSADVIETKEQREAKAERERRAALPALSSRQFWLAALEVGVTKADLLAGLSELEDAREATALEIEIKESATFSRDYPLVSELAEMKGFTSEELDALWIWASAI